MEIPLREEVCRILEKIEIPFPDPSLSSDIYSCCAEFRQHLLKLETSQTRPPLSGGSYWDITPKYRFDVLARDIPVIADQLAFAIGFSSLYLPQVAPSKRQYFPTFADSFFWYHIDFGFRLASSGWDRIALLLDIAFNLNLGNKCNIKDVLKKLPKDSKMVADDKSFKNLKCFRDTKLNDLEAKRGKGARHEATHLLSPSTRFLFEFLETSVAPETGEVPLGLEPKGRRDMLIAHHKSYIAGVQDAVHLIASYWSPR